MSEYFCQQHGTPWFKKGNMKGYAHPVKDANGNQMVENGKNVWCNMPEDNEPTPESEQPPTAESPPHATQTNSPPQANRQSRPGAEVGMWWNNLALDLRSGYIDKNTETGKQLRIAYFAEMFSVLGIEIKNKEVKAE